MLRPAAIFASIGLISMSVLTGCERKLSSANIEVANRQQEVAMKRAALTPQVKEGLALKEVESILGQPARVEMEKRPVLVQKNLEVTHWYYEQNGRTVELVFVDGNLQGKIPTFEQTPKAPAPMPNVITSGALSTHASQP